jgi:Domain of unknown function (DUF4062)
MKDSQTKQPCVFLSSVFKEDIAGERKYVPLRQRIIDSHNRLPVELWAYELFWPQDGTPAPDADTVIDRCFAGVRNCDLFVFLLTGRHGTGVGYVEGGVLASYLELELFAAAMLQKPVLVLRQRSHDPELPLQDTLDLLERTFAPSCYVVDDDANLYERFVTECYRLSRREEPAAVPTLAHLPDWLSRWRSRADFGRELADPRLLFLDGRFPSSREAASPDKAKILLEQVASGMRGGSAAHQPLPHGAALFRLWAAMRELMDRTESTLADPSIAPLWDRAFGMWASNASWFGLHGHLWMGPLASVQSQIRLRRKFAAEPAFRESTEVREPLGARASAIYSIAQRMHSWSRKLRHYRLSAALATQAISRDQDAPQGALSIRGHASMQMAQLGLPWKLWQAVADFKQSLQLREKLAASPASIGEAQADLGLALMLTGRRRAGLVLLREGVGLMRTDGSANGLAFLARGLRKLERGARLAGRGDIAEAARLERLQVAAKIEAMDQTREP